MAKKIYNIPEHKTVVSTPSTPDLGHSKIYPKSDNLWYFLNDAGVETLLGSGEGYVYKIGEYVPSEGGVIFHRYKDGTTEHYLVVAKSDAATGASWDNRTGPGQPPMLMNTSTWDGSTNYAVLLGSTGGQFTSAAYAVSLYSSVVPVSGWYLPAIDELNLLYNNRFNVNRTLSGNSSFGSISGGAEIGYDDYWSSTENGASFARYFSFDSGSAASNNKNSTLYVRGVRKFSITPVFPGTTTTTTLFPSTTTTTTLFPSTTTTTTLFPSTTTTTTQNN